MSTAWMDKVVLLREPVAASVQRLTGRAIVPVGGAILAGVPGTGWDGVFDPTWLRVVIWVIAGLGLVLWLLAIANLVRGRGVKLVMMPTGSIERPRSIQEAWLKRPQEFAIGKTIAVRAESMVVAGTRGHLVTLVGDTGEVRRVPLGGRDPEAWVAEANEAIKARGVTLKLEDAPTPGA